MKREHLGWVVALVVIATFSIGAAATDNHQVGRWQGLAVNCRNQDDALVLVDTATGMTYWADPPDRSAVRNEGQWLRLSAPKPPW